MEQLYKAIFHLGNPVKKPSLEDIAKEVATKWLKGKHGLDVPTEIRDSVVCSEDNNARIITAEDENQRYYGMIYNQKDSRSDKRFWEVSLAAAEDKDPQSVNDPIVEICLSTDINKDELNREEDRINVSRPTLVALLIDSFGAHLNIGTPLTTKPLRINSGNAKEIADIIYNPSRKLPVIFISTQNRTDTPIVDAEKMARNLSGLSYIFVGENRYASFATDKLLPGINCYNGAIRLYWPSSNDVVNSPLWEPKKLALIKNIDKEILELLAKLSVSRVSPVSIEKIRRIMLEKQIKSMTQNGEYASIAELYAKENDSLLTKLQSVQKLLEIVQAQNASYEHQVEAYKETIRFLEEERKKALKSESGAMLEQEAIDSMQTALRVFREGGLEGRILVAPRAERMIEKSPYQDPEQFLRALRWLGNQYFQAKTGAIRMPDLDASCREVCGMEYATGQSEITVGEHPEEYQLVWEGKKVDLTEHLKKGNGRNPEENLRIAFYFDKRNPRVVIGYVGVHQTNRKS